MHVGVFELDRTRRLALFLSCRDGFPYVLWIGLNILVDTCLDTTLEDDRKVAANFSLFWANTLKASLISKTDIQVSSSPEHRFPLFSLIPSRSPWSFLGSNILNLRTCFLC